MHALASLQLLHELVKHRQLSRRLREYVATSLPGTRAVAAMNFQSQATAIPTTHAAIASVDAHPNHLSQPVIVNLPMTRGFAAISIMTVMTGTATIPLITAVQYSALIGSIGLRLMPTPRTAAAVNVT